MAALANAIRRGGIRLSLRGTRDGADIGYTAAFLSGADDNLVFMWEGISLRPTDGPSWSTNLDEGHRETRLHTTIEASGREAAVAAAVVDLLRGCRVYHFHDTSSEAPVKRLVPTADNLVLRPDAANLAAVLLRLRDSGRNTDIAAYRRIIGVIQQVAPFFRDFVLQSEANDRVRLRWRERDSDAIFSAHQMSDGTLRFVCLAALLLQPALPALLVLDEPELGLHPFAIVQLAGLLRQASYRSQVVIATQSVTLMNQFELADLVVVERGKSGSTFVRPDRERLAAWPEEYSLGELWEKNLLGGRPGSVAGLPGDE